MMHSGHEQLWAQFQAELDAIPEGASLALGLPRERPGPVTLSRPAVIDGRGITVWSMHSPVFSVEADNVTLRNIRVEYTGETIAEDPLGECALCIFGTGVTLDNVEVRGTVIGVPGEEGPWRYPRQLQLGQLAHGMEHTCLLRLYVPVSCRLTSQVAGVEVEPAELTPGTHEVRVQVEHLSRDTLLSGILTLQSASLKRQFTLHALVCEPREGLDPPVTEQNRLVWEPPDWAALAAGVVPAPVEPPRPRPRPTPPAAVSVPVPRPPSQVIPPPATPDAAAPGAASPRHGGPLGPLFGQPAATRPSTPATTPAESTPSAATTPVVPASAPAAKAVRPKSMVLRPVSAMFGGAPKPTPPPPAEAQPTPPPDPPAST